MVLIKMSHTVDYSLLDFVKLTAVLITLTEQGISVCPVFYGQTFNKRRQQIVGLISERLSKPGNRTIDEPTLLKFCLKETVMNATEDAGANTLVTVGIGC